MAAFNNVSAISGYNNNTQYLNLDDCPPGCVDAINAINTRVNNLTTYINNALEGNIFMNNDGHNDGLGPMGMHELGDNPNPNPNTKINIHFLYIVTSLWLKFRIHPCFNFSPSYVETGKKRNI